ncbi:MAG: hypothetical protein JWM58_3291 [Rhizobium sp.]|nr:hypothetical protein [Rhizobium sp.]
MFYKDGFLTPAMVRRRLFATAGQRGVDLTTLTREQRVEYGAREFWLFASNIDCVYLLNPSGDVIKASGSWICIPLDVSKPYGFNFTVRFGILGGQDISNWKDKIPVNRVLMAISVFFVWPLVIFDMLVKFLYSRIAFGKFRGLAIMFSEEQLNQYLRDNEQGGERDAPEIQISSEKLAADKIIEWFDSGLIRSKSEAKDMLGQNLSVRAFGRAWVRASEKRSELSRPGRRSAE